eukprot:5573345-Pleurochrysis_carterae.AAC.1
MIRRQDPPQRSRGGHRVDTMYVDTTSDIDDDKSAADSNDMTEETTRLSLSCSRHLDYQLHKSGKPVCPSAVKPRRPAIALNKYMACNTACNRLYLCNSDR